MQLSSKKKLNNGVMIPGLGFGVYQISREETGRAVGWAFEAGYRHIDTARFYDNEKEVGQAVRKSGLKREEIFVTTKLWNSDARAGRQKEAFAESLKDLNIEYIDLYLIHWPVENFISTWKILEEIYTAGLVRAIGVSNFQIHHLEILLAAAKVAPATNQIESHPYLTQKELREYCAAKEILCEAWSPLGGGRSLVLEEEILARLAGKYAKSPAQIVLRWDLQRGIIPLPKSAKRERIISNSQLYDFELSREEMAAIDDLNKNKRVGPDPDNFAF